MRFPFSALTFSFSHQPLSDVWLVLTFWRHFLCVTFSPHVCSSVGEGQRGQRGQTGGTPQLTHVLSCVLFILRENMKRSVGLSFHHLSSQIWAAACPLSMCVCVCVYETRCVFSGPASPINIFKLLCLSSMAISPLWPQTLWEWAVGIFAGCRVRLCSPHRKLNFARKYERFLFTQQSEWVWNRRHKFEHWGDESPTTD